MGVKTRAIASFTMASILAMGVGLANCAWAEDSGELTEGASYDTPIRATCAELQGVVNNVTTKDTSGFSYIRLTESCSANLVIPSGKKVQLLLSNDLTNNGGDTITVEEGATFYYDGTSLDSVISNTTNGKAIINNHGLVRIFDANLQAKNGAYTTINSGELNILVGGNYTGTKISNTGTLRITDGVFDNVNEIKPYVINGGKIDETTGKVHTLSDGEFIYTGMPNGTLFPVGYTYTVKMTYPDYADAFNVRFEPQGAVKMSGSNHEDWTFTVTGTGMFVEGFRMDYPGYGYGARFGYEIAPNVPDEVKSLITNLVGKLTDALDKVQQAIEDGKTISLDLEIDNKTNVASEEKAEVAKVTGEDQVVGYFEIELTLKGDGEKLTNVTDLEDEEMEVRLPANFVDNLEKVAEGYTRNYYIVRLHEGVAEKINAKLEGKELVFKSGKFSTYAVAYTDTKTSDTPIEDDNKSDLDDTNKGNSSSNTDTKTPDTPNTGMLAYITSDGAKVTALGVLVAAMLSGLVASVVIVRKRQKNSK